MDFEKYFRLLKEKFEKIKFDDPHSATGTGFNMGAETMLNYGKIVLMELQNDYSVEMIRRCREKVNA